MIDSDELDGGYQDYQDWQKEQPEIDCSEWLELQRTIHENS